MTAAAKEAAKTLQPLFIKGGKQIYLPTARIALLNTTKALPPNYARFNVPLEWNKFDLRDYLHHAYGVRVLNVRSHVHQPKPAFRTGTRQLYLPKAVKNMTVQLEESFVWPKTPEDLTDWDPDMYQASTKQSDLDQDKLSPDAPYVGKSEDYKRNMRRRAKELMDGKKWTPTWQVMSAAVGGTDQRP